MGRRASSPGRCRECDLRREVFSCSRKGGGSYNRAQRHYSSSICAACALRLLPGANPGSLTTSSWDNHGLAAIVVSLGTEEAAEVYTAYRERRDRRQWLREEREAR
jgi:hypothetical protein